MLKRPQIVFLNRSYWPDIEATGQLLTDLSVDLARQLDIHVVCGQPNFPEPDRSFIRSGIEVRRNVTIHRLSHRTYQKNSRNPFGRVMSMISFYRAACRYLRQANLSADVIVSQTDPFLLPLAGAQHARRTGARHCVYLQDIYPDVAEAIGKLRMPLLGRSIRRQLRQAYQSADKIIVLGRCMRQRLTGRRWAIDPQKIAILPNWADCSHLDPIEPYDNHFRLRHRVHDRFVVMHSGNMGLTQRLEVLIRAAAEPEWPTRAKLLLVGDGASRDRLIAYADQLGLTEDRIEFMPYQRRENLAESLSAADVHVVSMHEQIAGCLCPSKLYGILSVGRPVIAIADQATDLSRLVAEKNLGWCVRPGQSKQIARTVAQAEAESTRLFALPHIEKSRQQAARNIALTEYDRPVIAERFSCLLHDMVQQSTKIHPAHATPMAPILSVGPTANSDIALLP
ncbi:glycosyltransferase family 4 protein [Roseiconus lacunae]|uniref:glycosyltransferase family 4 protein n=1 Tax=Roseiconus lacunae TaxID=2605694 RepID=UPI003093B12D|nr:glycosyltransferase family 4 protein [Stieleria sp. HD01]